MRKCTQPRSILAIGWTSMETASIVTALVRVRTPEVAEDLVQETLLVAVRSQDKFAGRSSERSWLVGILKNKVVDCYRKLGRENPLLTWSF